MSAAKLFAVIGAACCASLLVPAQKPGDPPRPLPPVETYSQGSGQGGPGALIASPYDVPQWSGASGGDAHQCGTQFPLDVLEAMTAPPGAPPPMFEDPALELGPEPEAPPLAINFSGIGATGWIPPDPHLAVGPSHVIQCVNETFRITDRAGNDLYTNSYQNWWSSVISIGSIFDPQVIYDQFNGRWIMLGLAVDCGSGQAWYCVSTSWTSNPFQGWCVWALRSDVDGSNDTNNWADYPKLGTDGTSMFIGSNQFACGGGYQYSKVRVMGLSQFYSNTCGGIAWWDFWNLGGDQFTTNPVHTFGFPGTEYLVSCNSGAGSTITVRSITGTWPSGSSPSLATLGTVAVGSFSAPVDATQPGGVQAIDTGDARLLNAVYRNGQIFTCHTIDAAGGTESRAHYVALSPGSLTTSVNGAFGATGLFYFYPAVMADPSGRLYTIFARCGSSEFAGCRYTRATAGVFEGSASLKAGEATYVALDGIGRNRWGDYSGIALDPVNNNFIWIYHQYAESSSANTWGTWVGQIGDGPGNDSCINATPIGDGVYSGTLLNASNDGTATCGASATSPDVWYSYTAACAGNLTVTTCGTNDTGGIDAGMDTVLAAFSSCGGSQLACNDDDFTGACGSLDQGLIRDSAISVSLSAGSSCWIRVSPYSTSTPGNFTLRTSFSMSNDACANATPIGNGVFNDTLVCATNDGTASCGASATNPDLWYSYTASCTGTLTVSTCGTHDAAGLDTGMDTVVSVINGCGGAELACNDDAFGATNCGGLDQGVIRDSALTVALTTGQNVRIRVSKFGSVASGPFILRTSYVTEACAPSLSTNNVSLNCQGGPTSVNVTLFNTSDCNSMTWSSSSSCSFLGTSPSGGSIPPNGSQIVSVQANCPFTPCGNNNCTISFNGTGCSPASAVLNVTAFGYPVSFYCTGKTNSLGCVPTMTTNGVQPSKSAGNFRTNCVNVLNNKNGLLFWGYTPSAIIFQGGFKCVASPTVRTPNISSGGSPAGNDCTGMYSFQWNTAYMNAYGISVGDTLYCQWWMRDPASPSTTGLSNATRFLVCL